MHLPHLASVRASFGVHLVSVALLRAFDVRRSFFGGLPEGRGERRVAVSGGSQ